VRSKKPSVITRLREETTFLLDRTLGRFQCANGLRAKGLKIEVHHEIFVDDAEDEEWIARCAQEKWVIITGDIWGRGRKEAAQVRAVVSGRVRVFQLSTSEIPAELWAQAILKAEQKIFKILKKNRGPFMARITPGGQVTILQGYFGEKEKDKPGDLKSESS
jgi:PIN like domain